MTIRIRNGGWWSWPLIQCTQPRTKQDNINVARPCTTIIDAVRTLGGKLQHAFLAQILCISLSQSLWVSWSFDFLPYPWPSLSMVMITQPFLIRLRVLLALRVKYLYTLNLSLWFHYDGTWISADAIFFFFVLFFSDEGWRWAVIAFGTCLTGYWLWSVRPRIAGPNLPRRSQVC